MPEVAPVASAAEILAAREIVGQVFVDEKVRDYVVDLVQATRDPQAAGITSLDSMIETGASPRASIWMLLAAKAQAFLQGRTYVTPHDVKGIAPDVLRHRIATTYEAEAEGRSSDDILAVILDSVLVP